MHTTVPISNYLQSFFKWPLIRNYFELMSVIEIELLSYFLNVIVGFSMKSVKYHWCYIESGLWLALKYLFSFDFLLVNGYWKAEKSVLGNIKWSSWEYCSFSKVCACALCWCHYLLLLRTNKVMNFCRSYKKKLHNF